MTLAADMVVNGMAGVLAPRSDVAPPEHIASKRCLLCRVVKPLSDFHARRGAPDGVQGECKSCMCARARGWYARHKQPRPDAEYAPDIWRLCHCPRLAALFADFDASRDGRRSRQRTARVARYG